MSDENLSLYHRLNRVQGQIEALKSALEEPRDAENCREVLRQLKAARNGLKKVGDIYITQSIDVCMNKEEAHEKKRDEVEKVLKTALDL